MLEKEIEKKVCAYAKTKGIEPYKFSSPARAAVPDRLFLYRNGVTFFIEFKAKGKEPTPAQWREITRIRERGTAVFVVDNVNTGKHIIDLVDLGVHPVAVEV